MAMSLVIGAPVGNDVFFHLAIARDYLEEGPFKYFTYIDEGLLSVHKADREPVCCRVSIGARSGRPLVTTHRCRLPSCKRSYSL